MNVLVLSTWFPYPPDNGSKIRAYYLLRALGSAHEVTLVGCRPDGADHDGRRLASKLAVKQVRAVPVDPFRYVGLPQAFKFCSPIPLAYWPSRSMRQAVTEMASSGAWDAVVSIQPPVASYVSQLPTAARVLDVDTSQSFQMHQRYLNQQGVVGRWRAWASWQKTHRYETKMFRRFQACTVVSATELDYVEAMVRKSGGRVELSLNGVDCEQCQPGLAVPRPNHLAFNGALTYSANYDAMQYFLAEIYPRIQAQVPDVSLTISGSTSGVDLAGLRLDESVHLSGYVEDIRPLVAGAWVCVVPIRQGGGTRLKILEAMALGTPVVATSKGAEGLDVAPGQEILLADDPEDLANQVVRVLGDRALRQQLATDGRQLVERRYDWAEIGRHFVDLVERTVAEHNYGGYRR
jgi:glycosyltransferase involved in cell wall biosynthesis